MPSKKPQYVFTQPLPTKGHYKIYSVATGEMLGMIKGENAKMYWEAFDTNNEFLMSGKRKKECMDYFREMDKKSRMAEGGGIGFEKLSNQVAKEYIGDKVASEYQGEYGKTYSKEEAKEVGDKVAGKVYWQQRGYKFGEGGELNLNLEEIVSKIKTEYPNVEPSLMREDKIQVVGIGKDDLLEIDKKFFAGQADLIRLGGKFSMTFGLYYPPQMEHGGGIEEDDDCEDDEYATGGSIESTRLKYAKKDIALVMKQGFMSIFGTKYGLLNLSYEDGIFIISDNKYNPRTESYNVLFEGDKKGAIEFVADSYVVEGFANGGSMPQVEKTYYIILEDGSFKEFKVKHPKQIVGIYFTMGINGLEKGTPMVHFENALNPLYNEDGTFVDAMPEYAGKDYYDFTNKMAEGGNVEEDQDYYRVFRNNAGKDIAVKIVKDPIFGKFNYYVDGSLRGQFETFKQAREEVNYENFDMYKDGGNIYSKDESMDIARTILQQMGGRARLEAFTGAYNFAVGDGSIMFRIKNIGVNFVKVKLNGKDLYDVTFGRVSGTNFKVVEQLDDISAEDLIDIFEKSTGMYLRFEDGGMMARGGVVVTSIKDIPNFQEELEAGRITYRGLGMGKLWDDFYKIAGEGGTRIKVKGKEYYITDSEFDTFSRDSSGKMRIKFDAPHRKFEKGGNTDLKYSVTKKPDESGLYYIVYSESGTKVPNSKLPKNIGYGSIKNEFEAKRKKYDASLGLQDAVFIVKKMNEAEGKMATGGIFNSEFYKEGGSVKKQKYAYVQAKTTSGKNVFKFFEEVPTHKQVYAYFKTVKDENGNPIILNDTSIHVEEVSDFNRDLFLEKANEIAIRTFGSPIKELDDMMFSFDKNSLSVFKFEAELENGMEVSIQTVDGMIVIEAEDEDKFKKGGGIDINFEKDTDYVKRENIKVVNYKNGKELYNWDYWDSDKSNDKDNSFYSGLYISKKPLSSAEAEKQYSMFKKGGKLPKANWEKLPKDAFYIKRSDIASVIVYDENKGEEIEIPANRIVNGIWFDNSRTQMIIDRARKEGLIPENKTKKKNSKK